MSEPTTFLGAIKKAVLFADKIIFQIIKWTSIVCFVGLFILVLFNVFIRLFPVFSMNWFDEIQVWLFAGLIFYGAAGLWILRDHFKLDVLKKVLYDRSKVASSLFNLVIELSSLFFIAVFTYESFFLSAFAMGATNMFRIPENFEFLSALFIPGALMVIYSIRNIALGIRDLVRAFHKGDDQAAPANG
jgi:TRAP-type C4-dicarboxylate transport system permease small subunit